MREAPLPTFHSLLSRASLLPHRFTASFLSSSALPSLSAPTDYRGTGLIDHGMPDVAVVLTLADGIHLQGNNTSGLGGNAPGGDGKDEKDKKVR